MDETTTTTKKLRMDNKPSRQSSINSNNLLKPDSDLDVELLRIKSPSLSNIAGKF